MSTLKDSHLEVLLRRLIRVRVAHRWFMLLMSIATFYYLLVAFNPESSLGSIAIALSPAALTLIVAYLTEAVRNDTTLDILKEIHPSSGKFYSATDVGFAMHVINNKSINRIR